MNPIAFLLLASITLWAAVVFGVLLIATADPQFMVLLLLCVALCAALVWRAASRDD